MMVPVRCFSCGFVVSEYYDKYNLMIRDGVKPKDAMDSLGVSRYCCRRIILSTKEFIQELNNYQK